LFGVWKNKGGIMNKLDIAIEMSNLTSKEIHEIVKFAKALRKFSDVIGDEPEDDIELIEEELKKGK
jgi:hypothetical protein